MRRFAEDEARLMTVIRKVLESQVGDPADVTAPSFGAVTGAAARGDGVWSGTAIDERGEAVEQALQPELEEGLQIEVVIGGGDALEDGQAGRFHD